MVAGTVPGHLRRIVVIACYLPPSYNKARGTEATEYITDIVIDMKRRFKDPFVIVSGDFNQWRLNLGDVSDMEEVPVGCTRGSREIDKFF